MIIEYKDILYNEDYCIYIYLNG